MGEYRTILIDPPWNQVMSGKRIRYKGGQPEKMPYETMPLDAIRDLPVESLAANGCHLWLWTTNQFLRQGFDLIDHWGFKYLAPITWIKPSGCGNWFVHRTQTMLFGYLGKCEFNRARYQPNIIEANVSNRHSRKPEAAYELIEAVSDEPRVELFARPPVRPGWDVWGNEVETTVKGQTCFE